MVLVERSVGFILDTLAIKLSLAVVRKEKRCPRSLAEKIPLRSRVEKNQVEETSSRPRAEKIHSRGEPIIVDNYIVDILWIICGTSSSACTINFKINLVYTLKVSALFAAAEAMDRFSG